MSAALRRRRLHLLALLTAGALLGAPSPSLAQDSSEGDGEAAAAGGGDAVVQSATEAELSAFRDTASRFTSRMREFEEEAKSIIDRREEQDKGALWESYNALLQELGEDERRLRDTAVSKFEGFLRRYPDSPESASIMFRLAELYFEKSEQDWFLADQEYSRVMDSLDADSDFDNLPEAPRKDYARSVALYKGIIDGHEEYKYIDGAYYMLGYCLSDPNSEQYDEVASLQYYQALIDNHGDSQFASAAHLRIGEYYFEYNDIDKAIPHYEAVVALEGDGGGLYDEGLYKLAWSHYKKSNYDLALDLMTQLLDYSEEQYLDTGKRSSMANEALQYSAISFSDVGDRMGERPIDIARGYYDEKGERPFEPEVYKRLADVLIQQARYEDAIDTYAFIQERYPNDPENPDYQWKIATLYNALPVPDSVAAQRTITELNDRYNDNSEWWAANQNNPDALSKARGYIERSLSAVAQTRHAEAVQTGNPADFAVASALYQEYLNEFPFADDYYEVQWYLADTLVNANQVGEAEGQFEQLLKSGEDHNYGEMALYRLSLVRRQQIIDRYSSSTELPDDAVVERTVEPTAGPERSVYVLSDLHREYVDTFDALNNADIDAAVADIDAQIADSGDEQVKARLTAQRDELLRYQEGIEKNRPALSYETGQIFYNHGDYEEARKRFMEVIDLWPERDEAAFAAKLVIDSYNAEGDLASVRRLAREFSQRDLGNQGLAEKPQFEDIEKQAAFLQAQAYVDEAKEARRDGRKTDERAARLAAAEAFKAYVRDYPLAADNEDPKNEEYFRFAFYNIGQNYSEAGELEKGNDYLKQYVDRFPDDEKSWPLMFRIANNYASIMDLENAVGYFEQLYSRAGKDYDDAAGALYNAAFLRIGMGDYRGAAEGFERYAREFPDNADAEKTMFQAGAQWAEVSDRDALSFYQRYLRKYKDASPDNMMEAYYQIATLTEESGARQRDIDKAWGDLARAYAQFSDKIGPRGRHYAAQAEYRELVRDFEAFQQVKFTRNDQKNAEILIQEKPDELKALENRALALVNTYQDFEYSSAALLLNGRAYFAYSDMIYNAPIPPEIAADPELEMLYLEKLDELRLPAEDKGRARLEKVLETAETQKQWSEYQTETLSVLSDRLPTEYAPEKGEIRGQPESNFVPSAGPMSVRPPKSSSDQGDQQ